MPTAKIFGLREKLVPVRRALSTALHSCVADALKFPADKPLQRFFPLDREDFVFPTDRTENYTIIEISMFEGRSVETKKQLVRLIYERVPAATGIRREDIDITIFETPRHAWGLTGQPGDEIQTTYKVAV